ncbi:MAG: multiheme c-type cytochrome [Gammaproteobacteria bacterium]|nr:multiheme c-type cytochrome [Gammaproteobacteria bacterium]
MHDIGTQGTVIVVAAVLLFFLLGIAIIVIIDHKARIKGGFTSNPFSIIGLRRDHPFLGFMTALILLSIILALLLEISVALASLIIPEKTTTSSIMGSLKEQRSAEKLRRFHNSPEQLKSLFGKKNICLSCHGDFPHSKKVMIRSLLNMHTQFVGCVTCHADPEAISESNIKLRWLNFSGFEVTGPPFGTDVNPKTGELVETDDYYSRIVAYRTDGGKEELMEITADDPRMQDYEKIKGTLSDRDREAVKKRFHKGIKDKGRSCSRCHTDEDKSFIPFRELGFSDNRIQDLTNLNIIGLVEKYKDFYMPSLLGSDSEGKGGAATDGKNAGTGQMKRDPRSWWKQMYDSPGKK